MKGAMITTDQERVLAALDDKRMSFKALMYRLRIPQEPLRIAMNGLQARGFIDRHFDLFKRMPAAPSTRAIKLASKAPKVKAVKPVMLSCLFPVNPLSGVLHCQYCGKQLIKPFRVDQLYCSEANSDKCRDKYYALLKKYPATSPTVIAAPKLSTNVVQTKPLKVPAQKPARRSSPAAVDAVRNIVNARNAAAVKRIPLQEKIATLHFVVGFIEAAHPGYIPALLAIKHDLEALANG